MWGIRLPVLGKKLGFPFILPLSLPPLRPSQQELGLKADSSRLAVSFGANGISRLGFPLWNFAFWRFLLWNSFFFLSFLNFIFGCTTGMWDLSFLTRDQTQAPCIGSMES